MKTIFEIWRDSDNVIKTAENGYKTQCGQYKKEHTENELKSYFIKEYCENNKERADEIADLFEYSENLPLKVKEIIHGFNCIELHTYKDCEELTKSLDFAGYTCEYGLDAEPYNLQKIETTNETPEEMNTTEKNNMIAKFMGKHYINQKNEGVSIISAANHEFPFDKDWNWLMEVVEKIESKCSNLGFEISTRFVHIRVNNNLTISSGVKSNRIEAVYNACIEFIEWYNEQNK